MRIVNDSFTKPLTTRVHASEEVWEPVDWLGILGVFGNVRVREIHCQRGQTLPGHTHNYAHAEAIVHGEATLRFTYPDGRVVERKIRAPEIFDVPAEVLHEVTAHSTEALIWCIFAVRDEEAGEIVEHVTEEHLKTTHYMR